MRKVFTLSLFLTLTVALSAQQLTNGDFETWTGGIPNGWSTTKSIVSSASNETQETAAPYHGSSAIKIVTAHAGSPIDTLSGFVHYGPAALGYFIDQYVSFPCHPDSIQFAYKYTSVGGDQGAMTIYFKGHFANFFIDGYFLQNSASYQLLTLPFYNGAMPGLPDSMSLTFYSSFSLNTNPVYHAGSTLWVDDVKFIYNNGPNCRNASAIDQIAASMSVKLFPNPADHQITLTANADAQGAEIHMYDALGRQVYKGQIEGVSNAIPTAALETGCYHVRVIGADQSVIFSGSVSVIH